MRSLRLALALIVVPPAALAIIGLPAGAQDSPQPVVTGAVQVTANADPTRAHASPQIARNPVTGELVVAETEVRTLKTCAVHISTNDGATWAPGGDPMMEPWTDCSGDPDANVNFWLEFDEDGVLYMVFPANDPADQILPRSERQRHIFLARSEDSGRTFETTMVWEAPAHGELDGGGNRNGRTWLALDPTDRDNVYVTWMNWWSEGDRTANRAMLAASSDGGRTFGAPVSLGEEGKSWYEARPAVDGSGNVHVLIPSREFSTPGQDEPPLRSAYHRVSSDGGRTWSEPTMVDQGNAGFSFSRKWGLEVDPDSDTLYVVWYGHPDPRPTRPEHDRDIYLRVSTDGGHAWSEPAVVNDDADMDNVQHYDPGISVAPNGRVDIAWLDFRNSPVPETEDQGNNGGYQDVYYTFSTDRGRTLQPNIRVTDRLIDRRIGVWSNRVHIHAPVGITSTDDTVYLVWQDSRNGDPEDQAEDVYFATVRQGDQPGVLAGSSSDLAGWAVAGAGVAVGMGVAMLLAVLLARRSSPRTARARTH